MTPTSPTALLLMSVESPWSVDIACALKAQGLDVRVIAPGGPEPTVGRRADGLRRLEHAGIPIDFVSGGRGRGPATTVRLARALRVAKRRHGCATVLALYGGNFAAATLLASIRPTSIYWVGSDVHKSTGARRLVSAVAGRRADHNLANGAALAAAANDRLRLRDVRVLYLGIDTDFWRPGDAKESGHIVCTRWFEPVYDNATIVRAYADAADAADGFTLTFTSGGSELAACREQAQGFGGAIEFLGGLDRETLRDEMQRAELYVSMALSDGTSSSLLEAMAVGCFPVLSDIPANREWLDHGCDLELVPPGDNEMLSRVLVRVASDRERMERAATTNRRIVASIASSDAAARSLAALVGQPRSAR